MTDLKPRERRAVPPQVVHSRLKRRTYNRFKAYTARTGASESAVINAALEKHLDNSADTALIIRRLDRLSRAVARTHRQSDTIAEVLSAFIQIWFAHTQPIPVEQQKAAKQSATKRHLEMIEFIRRRITGAKHVLVDLLGADEPDELTLEPSALEKGAPDGLDGE